MSATNAGPPDYVSVEILRAREARTSATLREIDGHIRRLTAAKTEREAALARIRTLLALARGSAVPEADED